MRTLILKISLLVLLVGIVNVAIRSLFYENKESFYWGNTAVTEKRNYLVDRRTKFNTIFIGSSKTYHQVNTVLFDNINKDFGTKSFNFGVQGMLPPESFYIYEMLVNKDSLRFNYAFIELDWIGTVNRENINVWRSFYYIDWDNYRFVLKSIIGSSMPVHLKAWGVLSRTINYLEKIYNFGYLIEYSRFDFDKISNNKINLENHGFKPINRTKPFTPGDLSGIQSVKNASEMAYQKDVTWLKNEPNAEYLLRLRNLISLSEKKGIYLIFLMPTQWKIYQYNELIPLYNQLDKDHFIEIADITKYPELYLTDNLFDQDHLNEKGAVLYTKLLAKKFGQIETKSKIARQ